MEGRNKIMLDVDPSIMEKNLLLEDLKDDELDSLISTLKDQQAKVSSNDQPWKLVKPSPGFVVKTRTEGGEKIFLNICHTDEIPAPQDICDDKLLEIMKSDEPSTYRLPLSIGDLHEEPDKSGKPSSVYDIAINSDFFHKIESNMLFRSFLLQVALEGVADKYNKHIDYNDFVILKNRKIMGSLQHHRIQQRGPTAKKVLIEEVKSSKPFGSEPRFQIIRDPPKGDPQLLTVQVHVKEASSGKNLLLDVGEDRLVLRSAKRTGSLLDIFLPYSVDQDHTCAHFDLESQVLSVELPVISVGN
ncbi:PIH1 domain-containing protein 1-like [Homalodisca vitripennis]|uniref:PIH1 domain-containing protein 1-like n=1 Tax=Homalodisca vitripennis TaxID=197043 RepID=UPI001EEC851C|nr:PIH1 domain-containing protein 1-like [Homalodisca vitripennis]XP_046664219.1 PIH1 domain-containing protein 1-like [Homalodisca vitripennis]XP_046664221.1 PIH1 domain-containing protein 1-like [Homalodisca vitripennis]XP_046664222.1 PIH1 domain-containing protein 1-like [Homalodisca vitripennis]